MYSHSCEEPNFSSANTHSCEIQKALNENHRKKEKGDRMRDLIIRDLIFAGEISDARCPHEKIMFKSVLVLADIFENPPEEDVPYALRTYEHIFAQSMKILANIYKGREDKKKIDEMIEFLVKKADEFRRDVQEHSDKQAELLRYTDTTLLIKVHFIMAVIKDIAENKLNIKVECPRFDDAIEIADPTYKAMEVYAKYILNGEMPKINEDAVRGSAVFAKMFLWRIDENLVKNIENEYLKSTSLHHEKKKLLKYVAKNLTLPKNIPPYLDALPDIFDFCLTAIPVIILK